MPGITPHRNFINSDLMRRQILYNIYPFNERDGGNLHFEMPLKKK